MTDQIAPESNVVDFMTGVKLDGCPSEDSPSTEQLIEMLYQRRKSIAHLGIVWVEKDAEGTIETRWSDDLPDYDRRALSSYLIDAGGVLEVDIEVDEEED